MTFYGTLHPYQQDAFDLILWQNKVLVAYEMGLGKTPITIAAIEALHDEGQVDAGLVVCQSQLKYQWGEAIDRFTKGEAPWLVIDGTPAQRDKQYDAAMTGEYRYVMVNYEQVVNDWARVRKLPRDFVVGDEITAIKGFRAQRSRRMKRLQAPYLVGLTGTPMENGKLEEVFSIMQWIDDRVLGRFDLFDRTFIVRNGFGGVERYRNHPVFRKRMADHWVRKAQTDPDVAPFLPKVPPPANLYPVLDSASARLYRRVSRELLADLAEAQASFGSGFDLWSHYGGGSGGDEMDELRGRIMSKMGALQMICDHPELLRHSAREWKRTAEIGKTGGSKYAAELADQGVLDSLKQAPKMTATVDRINEILDSRPENKVVLFSHDVATLDYLQDALAPGVSTKYSGAMNAKQKEASKKVFQTDPSVRVLLSSDAGGFGVDLPQGNYLINYDMPWSNGALKQRNSRIIRASSQFDTVWISNMLVRGSIDVWMHEKVGAKLAASDAFVDNIGVDKKGGLDLLASSLTAFLTANDV